MIDVLGRFADVRQAGSGWQARCPAHEDRRASLSIGRGDDDRWLLKCHAGCSLEAILSAVRLEVRDLFPAQAAAHGHTIVATYPYPDEHGAHLFDVLRFDPKDFRQRRADGAWTMAGVRRVLYRLPELRGQTAVYVVEGEKDVDRLWSIGLPATCNAGGAGKWRDEYTKQLQEAGVKSVVILPDNDAAGRRHAETVRASCAAAGLKARVVDLPDLPSKGDVSDWLDAGHSRDQLVALLEAPKYSLEETIAVFRRWLYLEDPSPVYAVAATLVANRAPGDPVWLLLVCAPSTGKTEILSSTAGLPFVVSAAKVTEASLLSGTSAKEKAKNATGGLLRQIGDFGVLLAKDFTSVLAQNKDARAEAMAALREVYDGRWDRPVGTDGGKVLTWHGKCGLLGGVTPAIDQYGQVTAALGDRFVLLRLPDADVDNFGEAALRHGRAERDMREQLARAMSSLVEQADPDRVNRDLSDAERRRLIALAAYTARARTAVVRDGYEHDVLYLPQVEGPGRLVKAYARLLGGLEAIGCDPVTAWETLTRIAVDCAPALRTKVIEALVRRQTPARTSDIATAIETTTKTAGRYLEDLSLLRLAIHTKQTQANNAPDWWEAAEWLRTYWPKSGIEKYPPPHQTQSTGDAPPVAGNRDSRGTGVLFDPTFDAEGSGSELL